MPKKRKKRDTSRYLVNRCTVAGTSPATIPKLSSFRLVVLLVDDKFRIDLLVGGQLPLVISFEAVFLFVMSGTGFTQSNFNAETGESKLSGRNVPIIIIISDDSLLGQPLTTFFDVWNSDHQFNGVG